MPNEYLTQDIELFISNRETLYNDAITDGTLYERATTQSPVVYFPEPEFTDDAGRAGNASEFQTNQCLKRFLPPSISITDRVNFGLYGKLMMRWAGGQPLAPVELSAGLAYQHAANMMPKSAGLQMPSMNAITHSGGASYLWPGMVVNDFTLSQQADQDVQIALSLTGSGKHRSPHLIGTRQVETATAVGTASGNGNVNVTVTAAGMFGSPRLVVVPVLNGDTAAVWAGKVRVALAADPVVSAFFLVSGASASIILTARHTAPNDTSLNIALANGTPNPGITADPSSDDTTAGVYTLPASPGFACLDTRPFLEYNDGALQDLVTGCRWRNWSVSGSNNHDPNRDRCGGDPRQKRGDFTSTTPPGVGAFLQKRSRGPRSLTGEITYLVDDRLREWEQLCDNVQLTGLTFGARGAQLDDVPLIHEALKVIIPKAKFRVIRGADSDGFAAFTMSFATEFDATAIGGRIEVINGIQNNYN